MWKEIKRLSDGILFQFLMVGSLSFSHIHDVVAAHGQAGWKSWLYPLSVDLLTVAAFRKIRAGHFTGGALAAFLLGLFASLAANIIDSWTATPAGRTLAVAIGVWPAVALLVCTLLSHDTATVPAIAPVAVAGATPRGPATVATATTPRRATVAAVPKSQQPKPPVVAKAKPKPIAINRVVIDLMAIHGDDLNGAIVADVLGMHRASGHRHLTRVREEIAAGKLRAPGPDHKVTSPELLHPPVTLAKADPGITFTPAQPAPAMSSSLSSSPTLTPTTSP